MHASMHACMHVHACGMMFTHTCTGTFKSLHGTHPLPVILQEVPATSAKLAKAGGQPTSKEQICEDQRKGFEHAVVEGTGCKVEGGKPLASTFQSLVLRKDTSCRE